jgi:signal-transduction protein with cAMP-binding, CBS, and nucleotidyltransferase domain
MNQLIFIRTFHPVTDEEYSAIQKKLSTRSFKKGEKIIKPGQVQRQLYFVKSGVQSLSFEKDNKSHIIAFTYSPNLAALPDSFAEQKPTRYCYTCLLDTEIDCLSYGDLQQLYKLFPNIETLFRKINERLLSGILNIHVEFRTLSIEERFKEFCRRSPHLLRQIPHKHIASYLGIDSTNFSKLFNTIKI